MQKKFKIIFSFIEAPAFLQISAVKEPKTILPSGRQSPLHVADHIFQWSDTNTAKTTL